MSHLARQRGFTLLEVLVALIIVAFGMGALMATLTSAADSVGQLREKSFAEWIALNRVSEMRLREQAPSVGKTNGVVEYAGSRWRWTQAVERTGLGDMIRIDVEVGRAEGGPAESQVMLAKAAGFIGGSMTRTRGGVGASVDWSGGTLATARPPPGGQPGPGATPSPNGTPAVAPPVPVPAPIEQPGARQ